MDLSALSLNELRELEEQIPEEIERREALERENVLNEMRALAEARGFSLEDFLSQKPKNQLAPVSKVKVKYQHPKNPEFKWTGRGRKPQWIVAWLANNDTLDALLV